MKKNKSLSENFFNALFLKKISVGENFFSNIFSAIFLRFLLFFYYCIVSHPIYNLFNFSIVNFIYNFFVFYSETMVFYYFISAICIMIIFKESFSQSLLLTSLLTCHSFIFYTILIFLQKVILDFYLYNEISSFLKIPLLFCHYLLLDRTFNEENEEFYRKILSFIIAIFLLFSY